MKKLFVIFIILSLVGCAALFKKTDVVVENGKTLYLQTTEKIDNVFLIADALDTTIYQPVKVIYYSNDTFTVAFYNLSDTEQKTLIQANDIYCKLRKEGERLFKDYQAIKAQAVKGYYEYYKIKDTAIKTEEFFKSLPKAIQTIAPYLKK